MSDRPKEYKFTKDHEWVNLKNDSALVGITDYAQGELGDVVYVDLPAVGSKHEKGSVMFTVESVKAVSDIYAPISGEVVEVNKELVNSPQLVNEEPFTGGWMVKLKPESSATEDLLDVTAYNDHVSSVSK